MAIYMHTIFIHVREICNCLCKSVWINLFMKFPWKSSWRVLQWWGKHEVMVSQWPNNSEQDNCYTIKSFNDISNYIKFEILKEYMKNICKLWIVRKDPIPMTLARNLRTRIITISGSSIFVFPFLFLPPVGNHYTEFCVYLILLKTVLSQQNMIFRFGCFWVLQKWYDVWSLVLFVLATKSDLWVKHYLLCTV